MERWNRMNRTIWIGKLSRREANLSPRVHGNAADELAYAEKAH